MDMDSGHEVNSVASRPVSSIKSDRLLSGVLKKTGVLERILLPAGCYLYYVRDEHGTPHFQSESSSRVPRSSRKNLGVVNPVCSEHKLVEKEYAVIREVVEVYLEEQLSGNKENRYRAGGFIQDQKQLLAKLAANSAHFEDTNPEQSLAPLEQDSPFNANYNDEEDHIPLSASRPALPPIKASRRSLLPISKSLHGDVTPRGPFFVKGSKFHSEKGERTGENSDVFTDTRSSLEAMAIDLKKTPFLVQKLPLSERKEEKKELELQPGFDVIRTTQQKYPTATPRQFSSFRQDHSAGQSTPRECSGHRSVPVGKIVRRENGQRSMLIPEGNLPLQLVSERSPMEERWREKRTRDTAGMTPSRITRADEEIPSCVTPPSGTFREPRYAGEPGSQRAWKPLESRKGPDLRRNTSRSPPPPMPTIQGRSYVTRMPSRIILNVILPREDAGQDVRLCSRVQRLRPAYSRTDTPRPSNPQPSPASTPAPTPPPPTAETHFTECPLCEAEAHAEHLQDVQNGENGHEEKKETSKAGTVSRDSHPGTRIDQDNSSAQSRTPPDIFNKNQENTNKETASADAEDRAKLQEVDITNRTCVDGSQNAASYKTTDDQDDGQGQAQRTDRKTRSAGMRLQSNTSTPNFGAKTSHLSGSGDEFWIEERRAVARFSSIQTSVPHLDLGPRMETAESTFHGADSHPPPSEQAVSSCRRATHCDLFGPELCADCETAQHRQQFSARQEILYPQIDVFPRHMVATQKFKDSKKLRLSQSFKSTKFTDGPLDNEIKAKNGPEDNNSGSNDGLRSGNSLSKNGPLDSNRKSRDGPRASNGISKDRQEDLNNKPSYVQQDYNSRTKNGQGSSKRRSNNGPLHSNGTAREGSQNQRSMGIISQPRWPYISVGQLNEVVTDLDLCKRIVEKGHRAKLPATFLTQPGRGVNSFLGQ